MVMPVGDEADVIRQNLDYHLAQGVDLAIVMENESTDGTAEILGEYAERGTVRLIRRTGHYDQGPWVTELARMAVEEEGADWVIPNDADEFWWPRSGTLKEELEGVPPSAGAIVCRRVNFATRPEDGREWWERMTLREVESVNGMGWDLPPKVLHRAHAGIVIKKGNHRKVPPESGETIQTDSIEVMHFQIRSYEQFERGVVRMGRAHEADPDARPRRAGRARRRQYQLWKRGKLRSYYDERVVATPDSGVVEDTRLRDFLLSLDPSTERIGSGSG
jgi:hypothetical protein